MSLMTKLTLTLNDPVISWDAGTVDKNHDFYF